MLSDKSLKRIDVELAKYPKDHRKSAIICSLRIAQQELGWLNPELIEFVANYIGIAPIAALEVASFYNMYDLQPVGKYKLTICTNISCALRGSIETAKYLKEKLNIDFGETTSDGQFTLVEGECMGACGDAPVILINNHNMCSFMTLEATEKKLAELS